MKFCCLILIYTAFHMLMHMAIPLKEMKVTTVQADANHSGNDENEHCNQHKHLFEHFDHSLEHYRMESLGYYGPIFPVIQTTKTLHPSTSSVFIFHPPERTI